MPNYKIEGDIDFYGSLYSSLDYDSSNENEDQTSEEKNQVCEITGQKLTNHFVTLECNHKFNYDAIYTEICKQKFEFQSYSSDVLSKKDYQKVRDSKLDYYIKCPYCRHVQFTLLPYHEELPFQKKYGVNTNDTDYRVIKTSYAPRSVPSNYTYMFYGYKFSQGTCSKGTINSSGKNVPCYNCYATPLVAPDGSTKLFCPNHVRAEAKAYKLEIKKKAIEDKLKAKLEAKEKALADKMAAAEEKALKKQKVLEEKKAKSETKKSETKKSETKKSETKKSAVKSETICVPCTAVLKTGTRKGEACGLSAGENNLCKRHSPK
jgi:hypothetical protein